MGNWGDQTHTRDPGSLMPDREWLTELVRIALGPVEEVSSEDDKYAPKWRMTDISRLADIPIGGVPTSVIAKDRAILVVPSSMVLGEGEVVKQEVVDRDRGTSAAEIDNRNFLQVI